MLMEILIPLPLNVVVVFVTKTIVKFVVCGRRISGVNLRKRRTLGAQDKGK